LSAFVLTLKQFPRARLIVAGDGPEKAPLLKQAADAGLKAAVDFVGWVAPANVPALINTATMVVMPSRSEALPLVALQAAQMARPVVAARVGGLPEVVVDRQTGLLVEKGDSEALSRAMSYLLRHPQTAARMGDAARERVKKKFDWNRHVKAYDRLYKKLVKAKRRASENVVTPGASLPGT
jgi:glycogen(starch) synthase